MFLKINFTTILVFLITFSISAQDSGNVEKVTRINLMNPAFEIEIPTGNYSTFSSALGVGYGGAYPELSFGGSGFVYIISPFLDLQQKWFYNLNKRREKGRETTHNSGNFVSARLLSRGPSLAENIYRTSNFDFAVGPTWGIQRKYGENLHFLFDLGPIFYADTKGNAGFYPIMLQINFGFDL